MNFAPLAVLLAALPAAVPANSATPAPAATAAANAFPASTAVESPRAEEQGLFDGAIAKYKSGDCDAAIPDLKTLVAAGFRGTESANALRDCYLTKYKSADGAVTALEAEVKANPNDEVAHSNLGCFYILQNKRDAAKTELIRALEINPGDLDARANLAFWYAQVGQGHTAINEYQNILKTDPDNRRSLTELCNLIAEQENDAKRAEPYCAKAAAGQESNEMLGVTLGLVRMRA
ncbi:MAG TPA: hypothetical protein VMV18_03820, partial [bacterium]|nr:hypothetical protein [bacterium]